MNLLLNRKVKYIVLIISLFFLTFSINYMRVHIPEAKFEKYNIVSNSMKGLREFYLHVHKTTTLYLLHDATLEKGEITFELKDSNDNIIEEYTIKKDLYLNKKIELDSGTYRCTIKSDVVNNDERFKLFFDTRYVTQEYIVNDSNTHNYY